MIIISLGGVGGCDLAYSLRSLNQETYPYDWLVTSQSFIINSFNDFNKFFIFDEKYVCNTNLLIDINKKGVMLHDFHNFTLQKDEVKTKYIRRFDKLNVALIENNPILFVRIYDNINESLNPPGMYDSIFDRDIEDISKWSLFINELNNKYNKKIKLLIITSDPNIVDNKYDNIIIIFTEHHKSSSKITEIINDTIEHVF
jgi:hypothetical protein